MKKVILLLLVVAGLAFNLSAAVEEPHIYMLEEITAGYGFGINMANQVPIDIGLTFPILNQFGFTTKFGMGIPMNGAKCFYHVFVGPTIFAINEENMRLPISLGIDLLGNNENIYMGFTGIVAFHYAVTKNIYIGISAEINYYINNKYFELIYYKDNATHLTSSGDYAYPLNQYGEPIYQTPVYKITDHIGSYVNIKPALCIGLQF
jgi:hypothetical protein